LWIIGSLATQKRRVPGRHGVKDRKFRLGRQHVTVQDEGNLELNSDGSRIGQRNRAARPIEARRQNAASDRPPDAGLPLLQRASDPNFHPAVSWPTCLPPAAPALRSASPSVEQWLHEVKFDDWRIQLHKHGRSAGARERGIR
jgi:ATP-dependent DNA ligase